MSLLFISHSSQDNHKALALQDWLQSKGWTDVFLDVSQQTGLTVGDRWRVELSQQIRRCDAMLLVISKDWLQSTECQKELTIAIHEKKYIFALLVEPIDVSQLDAELQALQLINLCEGDDLKTEPPVSGKGYKELFSQQALERFYKGLQAKGLAPETFIWPPVDEPHRKPYRGLAPMEAEDAGIFFGRDADIHQLLDELASLRIKTPPRFLSILGASGAGKSSFMRAGILPRLMRYPGLYAPLPIIRPEQSAMKGQNGLKNALLMTLKQYGQPISKAQLIRQLDNNPLAIFASIAKLARLPNAKNSPTLVIAIDQAEELFTSDGKAESETFLQLLNSIIHQDDVPIMVLCTIRSNAFEALQSTTLLTGVHQHIYSLQPIAKGAYQQIIEGPIKALKNTSEAISIDAKLTQALLDDIEKGTGKDALPLLAFTLEQLYNNSIDKHLSLAEYQQMGGIEGAIEKAVEKALREAKNDPNVPNDDRQCLALLKQGLIPWLAGIDKETKQPKRAVARLNDIPETSRPLINYFIDNRLLSVSEETIEADKTDEKTTQKVYNIELTHESVLRQWARLNGWLQEDLDALSNLDALQSAAMQWEANGRNSQWLNHKQGRLADAEALLTHKRFTAAISQSEREYLKKCRQKERRGQRLLMAGFFFAIILATGASFFAYQSNKNEKLAVVETQKTQEALVEANHNYALALNEKAIQAEKEKNIDQEMLYRLHMEKLKKDNSLIQPNNLLMSKTQPKTFWSSHHTRLSFWPVKNVAISSGDGVIITNSGEGKITSWDSKTGNFIKSFQASNINNQSKLYRRRATLTPYITSFSSNGKNIVTHIRLESIIKMWDTKSERLLQTFDIPNHLILNNLYLSNNGNILASSSRDSSLLKKQKSQYINIWEKKTGQLLKTIKPGFFEQMDLSPDGSLIAIAKPHSVELWNIKTEKNITLFKFNRNYLVGVRFSPDGKKLASVLADNTIRLWDIHSFKQLAVFKGHSKLITSIDFSPDGKKLASSSDDKTLRVWDIESTNILNVLKTNKSGVNKIKFYPDNNKLIYIIQDRSAGRWNLENNQTTTSQSNDSIDAIALSPNNKLLATAFYNQIILWETVTGKQLNITMKHYGGKINDLDFSPDGEILVYSSSNGTVRLWNLRKNDYFDISDNITRPRIIKFSPSGQLLAIVSSDHTIHLWDKNIRSVIKVLKKHKDTISNIAFSPDGKTLISGSHDQTIRVWDIQTGNNLKTIDCQKLVRDISLSPDGKIIASALRDDERWAIVFALWDTAEGKIVKIIDEHLLNYERSSRISFSPDGKKIAFNAKANNIRVFDANNFHLVETLTGTPIDIEEILFFSDSRIIVTNTFGFGIRFWNANGYLDSINKFYTDKHYEGFESSRDGKTIAFRDWNGVIKILDNPTKKIILTLGSEHTYFAKLSLSPNGKKLIAAAADGSLNLWNIRKPKKLKTINAIDNQPVRITDVKFSHNGKLFAASYDDNIIRIWDNNNYKLISTLIGHEGRINCITFSPDGKLLASGSDDKTVRLWDIDTNRQLALFDKHTDDIYSIDISRNGKILASGDRSGDIYLWSLETKELLANINSDVSSVHSLAFSPTSDILASGHYTENSKNNLFLWNTKTGKRIAHLDGQRNIFNLTFTSDGKRLFSSSREIFERDISNLQILLRTHAKKINQKIINYKKRTGIALKGLKIIEDSETSTPNLFKYNEKAPDYPKYHPFRWLPLAEKGDANAMLQLGIIEHRDSHWEKAKQWYEKARDAGNPDAEERLQILKLTKQYEEKNNNRENVLSEM